VDTGHDTNIGGRLRAVREYLDGDEMFLANYSDNLTDVPLTGMIDDMKSSDRVASFLCVRPSQSFHLVSLDEKQAVSGITHVGSTDIRINGGYFVLRKEIFDQLRPGEELVEEPFQRLIDQRRLGAYKYDGFFVCMDTFKERQVLDDLYTRGEAPWELWNAKRDK
jgi:glucose-1-phosphate cytidylyltransferase